MRYRPNLTLLGVSNRAVARFVARRADYQPSLWGDTYLTPEEARIYIQQMLQMLRTNKPEKTK